MRGVALALVVLAGAATASGVRQPVGQRVRTSPGQQISNPAEGQVSPAFTFAVAGSAVGLPYAGSLCDALTEADKVGPWECYRGDNTSSGWDGGTGIYVSAGGSPAAQTMSLCPNGPSCSSVTRDVENANDGRKSTSFASGTGSVSACWLGIIDGDFANYPIFTQSTGGGAATVSWYINASAGATVQLLVSDGSTLATANSGATGWLPRAEHLMCGTWSGANGAIAYLDGAAGTPVARATRQSLNAAPTIHGVNGGTLGQPRIRTRGAFFTATELSAARIAAIARAVLADRPTGTKSEALTFTRATASSCALDANESELTYLASGRPCITRGGLQVFRAGTNLCLRSEEGCNAAYADVGTPACASDAFVFSDGSLSMDTITDNDAAAFEGRSQAISTTSQTKHTFSSFVRCATGACEARLSIVGTGNSAGDATCDFTGLTTTPKRLTCTSAAAYGAGLTAVTVSVLSGDAVGDQYVIGFAGQQHEANASYASPYVRTTSASVTRNAEVPFFTIPGIVDGSQSLAVSVVGPTANVESFEALISLTKDTTGNCVQFISQDGTSTQGRTRLNNPTSFDANCPAGAFDGDDRFAAYSTGIRNACCRNGACGTESVVTGSSCGTHVRVYLGSYITGTLAQDGIFSNACADSSTGRCR